MTRSTDQTDHNIRSQQIMNRVKMDQYINSNGWVGYSLIGTSSTVVLLSSIINVLLSSILYEIGN